MHLLYLDYSGSPGNTNENYLVLGGLSVFEAQAHWFTTKLDALAQTIDPANPLNIEFHASEIYARRTLPWKNMSTEEARGVIKAVLEIVRESYETARVFACAVHKASFPTSDPVELAFQDLSSRFDKFLVRLHSGGDRQRGILILDKDASEITLQRMAI